MAASFVIQARDPGASLTLTPHDRDYFIAELRHAGLMAAARVGTYLSGGIGDLFAGFASQWRGWEGSRNWGTLEEELVLTATSDRAGHVLLRVRLQDGASSPGWEVEAQLVLEAGQMERLADEARAFERGVWGTS